jgi:hypothetical protein
VVHFKISFQGSDTTRLFLDGKSDTPQMFRVRGSWFDQAWRTAFELTEVAPPLKPAIENAPENVWLEPVSRAKVAPAGTGIMNLWSQRALEAISGRIPPVHIDGFS